MELFHTEQEGTKTETTVQMFSSHIFCYKEATKASVPVKTEQYCFMLCDISTVKSD